jgi:hypothetical protein
MSSPGLLAKALAASSLHARPVIGTIAFHLGPSLRSKASSAVTIKQSRTNSSRGAVGKKTDIAFSTFHH